MYHSLMWEAPAGEGPRHGPALPPGGPGLVEDLVRLHPKLELLPVQPAVVSERPLPTRPHEDDGHAGQLVPGGPRRRGPGLHHVGSGGPIDVDTQDQRSRRQAFVPPSDELREYAVVGWLTGSASTGVRLAGDRQAWRGAVGMRREPRPERRHGKGQDLEAAPGERAGESLSREGGPDGTGLVVDHGERSLVQAEDTEREDAVVDHWIKGHAAVAAGAEGDGYRRRPEPIVHHVIGPKHLRRVDASRSTDLESAHEVGGVELEVPRRCSFGEGQHLEPPAGQGAQIPAVEPLGHRDIADGCLGGVPDQLAAAQQPQQGVATPAGSGRSSGLTVDASSVTARTRLGQKFAKNGPTGP